MTSLHTNKTDFIYLLLLFVDQCNLASELHTSSTILLIVFNEADTLIVCP